MIAEARIEPKVSGKGRTFRATLLASVTADALWAAGATDTDWQRPVFAVFAGSEGELRPFAANLLLGRRVLTDKQTYRRKGLEFLKSARYRQAWQREAEGSIVTVFLPELFLLDPGMVDPVEAKFVLLPSARWAEEQKLKTAEIVRYARGFPLIKRLNTPLVNRWEIPRDGFVEPFSAERLASMVPTAYLFAAYLDRRTRAPIPADGRFYLQLMLACLEAGLASWASSFSSYSYSNDRKFGVWGKDFEEDGCADAGLLPGVAFKATHEALEALLAEEIATFFALTGGGKKITHRKKEGVPSRA